MCVFLIPNESIDPKSLQVTRDGARMPAARKITFKFRTKWRVFTLSIPLHPSRLSCKDLMTPFLSQSQQCPTLLPASIPTTSRGPPTPCVTHLSLPLRVQRLPQGAHALAAAAAPRSPCVGGCHCPRSATLLVRGHEHIEFMLLKRHRGCRF